MAQILIVDDEKQNVDALVRSLGDQNPSWRLLTATNEQGAVAILEAELKRGTPIDILLTDLVMSDDHSGMKLLHEARRIDQSIMTILFTANEKSLDRYAAFDAGAFDVVEKNIRGVSASREINIKTRAALRYREWFRQINFARRYFDPRIFEMINSNPALLDLRNRHVVVVFWDIRGFSLLCEILKGRPELIADFLREYCEAAAKIIFSNNGVLDKFIGDGVMALFGVLGEEGAEDTAYSLSAVRAAVALRKRFAELLQKWLATWMKYTPQQIVIELGCGIHAGEALVGNVGTDFRDQFTALGSTVNFASRIEQKSRGGTILVSQSVETRLKHLIEFTHFETLNDVKNIPGNFAIFEAIVDDSKSLPHV